LWGHCDGNGSSEPGYDEIPQKVQVTVTVTVALNPGMMKYHKKFRSLTVTVRSSEPGYDEIPQKVQDTVTVTIAKKPGYDEIPQKVQVIPGFRATYRYRQ
jgi:hypothetical protein